MQAASSPRAVVPASSACTSAVRPVDPSPVISEICPRAIPPYWRQQWLEPMQASRSEPQASEGHWVATKPTSGK